MMKLTAFIFWISAFILLPAEKVSAQAGCPLEATYPVKAQLHISADKYFLISLERNDPADFDTLRDVRIWAHNIVNDEIIFTGLLYTIDYLAFEENFPCLIEDNLITGSDTEGYCISTSERNTPFTKKGISGPFQIQVTLESKRPSIVVKSNIVDLKAKPE